MEPDETRVRAQIHRALGDLEAAPWLRSGVMTALPDRTRPPLPLGVRTAGTLAAVLVIALIGSSVLLPGSPADPRRPARRPRGARWAAFPA